MNAEKYTRKTLEAFRASQTLAQEQSHQYITPEHLFYALLDQDEGLIPSIFARMGADCTALKRETMDLIRRLPRVSGSHSEVYASPETAAVITAAEKTAEKLQDEYVSVEHLMLALFGEISGDLKNILQDHGITRSRFSEELSKV